MNSEGKQAQEAEEAELETESGEQKSAMAEEQNQSSGQKDDREIWIDVSGAVKTPGVYRLKEKYEVFEAVQAAGDFLRTQIPSG